MAIYEVDGMRPCIAESAFVADNARVIGDVTIADEASIWFGAVIRGDADAIRIGQGSNIQDVCVLHTDPGAPLTLGSGVTVGHQAVLHGCTVGDHSLIGIGAIVLNGVHIGKHCLVGAGALVTEGKRFADGSLIIGSPARAVRLLTPDQIDGMHTSARHYVERARRYQSHLQRIA